MAHMAHKLYKLDYFARMGLLSVFLFVPAVRACYLLGLISLVVPPVMIATLNDCYRFYVLPK
jgi:hypothetical protein